MVLQKWKITYRSSFIKNTLRATYLWPIKDKVISIWRISESECIFQKTTLTSGTVKPSLLIRCKKEYKFVSLIHKEKKSDEWFPSGLPFILLPSSLLLCIRQNLGTLCFIYLLIKIWCFELKLSAKLCAVCRCKINFSLLISHSVRSHKITFMHGDTYVFVASIVRQMTFKLSL